MAERQHNNPGGTSLVTTFESARFIQSLYRDLVGRAATRSELDRATELLSAKGRPALVATLLYGEEALARQVRALYERHLMRAATDTETADAVVSLRSGVALDKLIAWLLATDEYAAACDTQAGAAGDARFISAVFSDLLCRLPDAAEHAALAKLASEGRGRLVLSILRGVEFRSRCVADLYHHLLHRPAHPDEIRPWTTRGHTGIDLQKARVAVLAGREYFERWC